MSSTSKRAATSLARYPFSDDEEALDGGESHKNGKAKKKAQKPKTVVCKICNKKYTDRNGLVRHMELHTDTQDYSCDVCDARFKTTRYLQRHQKRVHGPPIHECDFCGKLFSLPLKLRQHRLIHTCEKPHKCEVCGKKFRALYSLTTHRYVHTNEKPFKCMYCPYACRDSSTLRKHQERHTSTGVFYQCNLCSKKYVTKTRLKEHVLAHHTTEVKMVSCEKCSSKFKTVKALNSHIRLVHERAYRATCEVCGVEIANKYNMSSHLRSHLKIRPFKCRYKGCNMRFKDKSTLDKHAVIHKPRKFSCDYCGRLFTVRSRLNYHLKVHDSEQEVICDHCGFSFNHKSRLIRHLMKHMRHRQTYVCDVCRYVTHRKLSIEKHMVYGHGDEHDVHCKICDKDYKLHAYLITHYYNRHGIRYKTIKNIKLETSVTIKEEPGEPIPDVEVNIEDIQKQETLADIITDVALDHEATDIQYSKSVLAEDITRIERISKNNGFRKKLRGRSGWLEEQNTVYARKELEVKKRIKKLLARVREKKWTRILEEARQQYNRRISALSHKNKENNFKIKYININQSNNNETDKNDNENSNINTKNQAIDKDLDKDRDIINDEKPAICVEIDMSNNYNKSDNGNVDDTASLTNDNELSGNNIAANVYEDMFDVEENPVGDDSSNLDEKVRGNENDDNGNEEADNGNETDHSNKTNKDCNDLPVNLIESEISPEDANVNHDKENTSVINDTNAIVNEKINDNVLDEIENCESNENEKQNDNENVQSECDNNGKEECVEGNKGKNMKLKINTHQCYICFKLYETKEKLLEHCQIHFDVCTNIPLKKCPLCNYVTKLTITRHIKLVHGINITLPYHVKDKNKNSEDKSRYCYAINNKVVKEIEVIPSVKNLNKIAYVKIDKNNRINKDMAVAKTKLVKKSGEWVVEHENVDLNKVNKEFMLPEFDKNEIKRLKFVGDQYLDVLKALGRLAARRKAKMLYPCNGCEKLCKTFSALKLHSRRHESNPKPFKKKVWKHKLKGVQKKAVKTVNSRKKEAEDRIRKAEPKPIKNKHKCDKALMEFYEKNVKGADIEFWQFLKIYNRMNKDHADTLKDLKETNEFGDYTIEDTSSNDNVAQETTEVIVNNNNDNRNIKNNKHKVKKVVNSKKVLSKKERLRRALIKEELRKKINSQ